MTTPNRTRRTILSLLMLALMLPAIYASFWLHERLDHTPLPADARVTHIQVSKSAHELTLFDGQTALKTYAIAIGRGGAGQKQREGDGITPIGDYTITTRNPQSSYYKSMRISYPTPAQRAEAASRGDDPGGDIVIHGLPNRSPWLSPLQHLVDWTQGCIALSNRDMDELWIHVPDGTPITIDP